jgi:hypothetical protein
MSIHEHLPLQARPSVERNWMDEGLELTKGGAEGWAEV